MQTAIPVDGQCLRRRRVPTLDFPTNIPMWEIYGLNPYAPIKVQPIPFMPLQVSNVAAVRVAESVEVLGDQDKVIEDAILEQLVGKAEPENSALKGEIESLKRDLDQIKAIADENLKRAKRAELEISKFKTKPKVGGSKGQNTDAVKGDAKGRRAAKRGTAALKQELAKIEKNHSQIYYHAINLAFLSIAYQNNESKMLKYARMALKSANKCRDNLWKYATVAEANMYIGKIL